MPTKRKLRIMRSKREKSVLAEIADIRSSLEGAYSSFNTISDPLLMEACIFEINALRARYDHALKSAKDQLM